MHWAKHLIGPLLILTIIAICPATLNAATHSIPITAQNSAELSVLTRLGKGWPTHVTWAPDTKSLAVQSSVGVWLYATKNYNQAPVAFEGYTAVAYSHTGSRLALVNREHNIELRDATASSEVDIIQTHGASIHEIAFSLDDSTLVTVTDDAAQVWDIKSRSQKASLTGIAHVVLSEDGLLAVGVQDDQLVIWNTRTGSQQAAIDPLNTRNACDSDRALWIISPNSGVVACIAGIQVSLWDTHTGKQVGTLIGPENDYGEEYNDIVFSPDSGLIAVAGGQESSDAMNPDGENAIWVWNVQTGQKVLSLHGHKSEVVSVAFSPDGKQISSSSGDGTIRLWNVQTGKEVIRIDAFSAAGMVFSPNNDYLAAWRGKLVVWNTHTGNQQTAFEDYSSFAEHVGGYGPLPSCEPALIFSANGSSLASADSLGTARLWDLNTLRQRAVLQQPDVMNGLLLSSRGSLALHGDYGSLQVWDAATQRREIVDRDHPDPKEGTGKASFSPDGNTLAFIDTNGIIQLWSLATDQKAPFLQPDDADKYTSLTFSPNGTTLATIKQSGTIILWNRATKAQHSQLANDHMTQLAFSPDGTTLAAWSPMQQKQIYLWNIATQQQVTIDSESPVAGNVVFGPAKTQITWTTADHDLHIADISTGAEELTFHDPLDLGEDSPSSMLTVGCGSWTPALSPDGLLLASSGKDGVIRIWDTTSGTLITKLAVQQVSGGYVTGIAFSPDGTLLASVSEDGSVRLWGLTK